MDSTEDFFAALFELKGKEKEEEKKAAAEEACKEGGILRYWLDKFLIRIQEAEKRGVKSGLFVGENITRRS